MKTLPLRFVMFLYHNWWENLQGRRSRSTYERKGWHPSK